MSGLLLILTLMLVGFDTANHVANGQHCNRLFMQGLDNIDLFPFAGLSGVYRLTNRKIGSLPVYKHERNTNYYFFYNATLRELHLGGRLLYASTSGVPRLVNTEFPYSQLIHRWYIYDPVRSNYNRISSPKAIQPRCVDNELHRCDSGFIEFNRNLVRNRVNIRRYQQVFGIYSNFRPAYKAIVTNPGVTVYMYHLDNAWRLGTNYWSRTSFGVANDMALRPEHIIASWSFNLNGYWEKSSAQLSCSAVGRSCSTGIRCLNGGTCVQISSTSAVCECPDGFRGQLCESLVPSCRNFSKWMPSFDGFYYSTDGKDNLDGSVSTWFCRHGPQQFGFSVCRGTTSWHGPVRCGRAPLATGNRPIWPRRKTRSYGFYSSQRTTKKPDIFKEQPWVLPVILVSAILGQLLMPVIIYYSMVCCCGYNNKQWWQRAEKDQNEDKALVEKYRQLLADVEKRFSHSGNEYATELYALLQQLEDEKEEINGQRRARKREAKKKVKVWRTYSWYYYISFWIWLVYIIIHVSANLSSYSLVFNAVFILGIIFLVILQIVVLIESCRSAEKQYIGNLSSVGSATICIEAIRNGQPVVTMKAECYHFEQRTRVTHYTDANGNMQTSVQTYQEKVVTANIAEPFIFAAWCDVSKASLEDIRTSGITKIKMELIVKAGDEETNHVFQDRYNRFKRDNQHRDQFVDFSIGKEVPGFQKRLAAYTDPDSKQSWISSVWFWVATVFCCGWPYRVMFNRATARTDYEVIKHIFVTKPSGNMPTDDPPIYEGRDLYAKTRIEAILNELENPDSNSENTTMGCARRQDYVNIPLRDACHVVDAAKTLR